MWRWYVEVAFLVVLCFGLGAAVASLVLARLLPSASRAAPTTDTGARGGTAPEGTGAGS